MSVKTDEAGFLKRWSARKLADDQDVAKPGEADPPAADSDAAPAQVDEESPTQAQTPPPDLPDVASLDGESDYSVFLGENVPEDLARLALRKLWRSDPALANMDGLNDYDADYSLVGKAVEAVKTAYRVGRQYADNAEEMPPGEMPEDTEPVEVADAGSVDEAADEIGDDVAPASAGADVGPVEDLDGEGERERS